MTPNSENIKVVLIGAGRVGHHLGRQFHKAGIEVVQVYNRNIEKAKKLARLIDCQAIDSIGKIFKNADLYVLAISDDAIKEVAEKLSEVLPKKALAVHTSGAVPGVVFESLFTRFGTFYPLQTFSFERQPDFSKIPICIHANQAEDLVFLETIARKINSKTHRINDEQRAVLHIAAVFVNNFSNHLFHIGNTFLENENLSFELLKPLINETIAKLEKHSPGEMQTGPAVREDQKTIQKHLKYLSQYPDYQELYRLFSESIQKINSGEE